MKQQERVKVFIGSGEASLLERKTLIYSLRKHTQRDLDIYVFNGTHNAIELNDGDPFLAPMSLTVKYRNTTEFSLYRYLIPEICQYQGKAIYLDSDTICLTDISELFDAPTNNCDFLATREAYSYRGTGMWGLSVMLIDCERCRFDLEAIWNQIDQGLYSYTDFSCTSPAFLAYHPFRVGELDPQWNVFDYWDNQTKLIHYTNLYAQPWRFSNHPYGELWFEYLYEAIATGYVTQKDIELSQIRGYVRQDLLEGNRPINNALATSTKRVLQSVKQSVKTVLKRTGLSTRSA